MLIFAIVYQVHRNELINEEYSKYLGFGTTDPWDIHGSAEKREAKPTEARYEARREHLRQTCQNFPTDSFVKRTYLNLVKGNLHGSSVFDLVITEIIGFPAGLELRHLGYP